MGGLLSKLFARLLRVARSLLPKWGWRQRVLDYRGGKVTWTIPGNPELPMSCPWPMEWSPYEWADVTEHDPRGWTFKKVICIESGLEAEGEAAANCARCGVPLHVRHANMTDSLSIPACSFCVDAVDRVR